MCSLPCASACSTAEVKVFTEESPSKSVRQRRSVLSHSFLKTKTGDMLKASLCSCTICKPLGNHLLCASPTAGSQTGIPAAMHSREFAVIGSMTNLSCSLPSSFFSKQCAKPCQTQILSTVCSQDTVRSVQHRSKAHTSVKYESGAVLQSSPCNPACVRICEQ